MTTPPQPAPLTEVDKEDTMDQLLPEVPMPDGHRIKRVVLPKGIPFPYGIPVDIPPLVDDDDEDPDDGKKK